MKKITLKLLNNCSFWTCLVQFSSVAQSCPTLCDPMNCSTPGLPVHHQLPEFTQTHVHWVGDVIQPSHPLSSPSPPAPNPTKHQSLFQWVNMRWPKYWSFSFSIIPSKEHPGLIFFRMLITVYNYLATNLKSILTNVLKISKSLCIFFTCFHFIYF